MLRENKLLPFKAVDTIGQDVSGGGVSHRGHEKNQRDKKKKEKKVGQGGALAGMETEHTEV